MLILEPGGGGREGADDDNNNGQLIVWGMVWAADPRDSLHSGAWRRKEEGGNYRWMVQVGGWHRWVVQVGGTGGLIELIGSELQAEGREILDFTGAYRRILGSTGPTWRPALLTSRHHTSWKAPTKENPSHLSLAHLTLGSLQVEVQRD